MFIHIMMNFHKNQKRIKTVLNNPSMKKILLLLIFSFLVGGLIAQTWKTSIFNTTDQSKTRTIKLKPEMELTVRSKLAENDSLSLSKWYTGKFVSGTKDSIIIKITRYNEYLNYKDGTVKQTTITSTNDFNTIKSDKELISIPLSEIHYLKYQPKNTTKMAEMAELPIFISLFAIIISPLVCIDYKTGEFNADLYQYLGVGSAAALTASFGMEIIINRGKTYQFKADWPNKKQKVWSFKKGI